MHQPPANSGDDPPIRILAVGMPSLSADNLPANVVAAVAFDQIDAALIDQLRPDQILVPLIAASQDAMAVIERLEEIGYAGLITVVASQLPEPRMVEAELRALGPGNRLTLLTP